MKFVYFVIFGVICVQYRNFVRAVAQGTSVEYVRLPLLVNAVWNSTEGEGGNVKNGTRAHLPLPSELYKHVGFVDDEEDKIGEEDEDKVVDDLMISDLPDEEEDGDDLDNRDGTEGDDIEGREFDEVDLIQFVQDLERQADVQEKSGAFPEILDILHGTTETTKVSTSERPSPFISTATASDDLGSVLMISAEQSSKNSEELQNLPKNQSGNATLKISFNEDGDLQLPSEDISDFSEEIVDGITAGIEESLRMSDDLELSDTNKLAFPDNSSETRQFSVYLFQGQYYAEPRLNRFVDGALRNMGTELRVASMDPLYFRVLPRGQVAEREQPLMSLGTSGMRRRRPVRVGGIVKRQVPAFFRPMANKFKQQRKKIIQNQKVTRINNGLGFGNKRQQQQRLQQLRRRRQQLRQQKLRKIRNQKRKQLLQQKRRQNQKKNQQQLLQRIRRRIKQDVGGGRIEGLSRVQRDGDAEMQLFGNYTLIRSHMKIGPLEITMQFRTKNGIRRTGATLPVIRAHTVTRVNHEGSEMIDYLLDRPHPEMIRVRGTQFPLAQKIARNIFSRLFLPTSFLVQKLREKAGLAYLSKPVRRKR